MPNHHLQTCGALVSCLCSGQHGARGFNLHVAQHRGFKGAVLLVSNPPGVLWSQLLDPLAALGGSPTTAGSAASTTSSQRRVFHWHKPNHPTQKTTPLLPLSKLPENLLLNSRLSVDVLCRERGLENSLLAPTFGGQAKHTAKTSVMPIHPGSCFYLRPHLASLSGTL